MDTTSRFFRVGAVAREDTSQTMATIHGRTIMDTTTDIITGITMDIITDTAIQAILDMAAVSLDMDTTARMAGSNLAADLMTTTTIDNQKLSTRSLCVTP